MFTPTNVESKTLSILGTKLKETRIEQGLYQAEFASKLGISTPTYRKMEQGHISVPIAYWLRVISIFGQNHDSFRPEYDTLFSQKQPASSTNRQRVSRNLDLNKRTAETFFRQLDWNSGL